MILVAPSLFLLLFLFPGIMFLALYKNSHSLETVNTKMKYGFLY